MKSPLIKAIYQNDDELLSTVEMLLDEGADPNEVDEDGSTPLMIAAELGATECVRILLDAGADAFKEDHIPCRAIEYASNLNIVRMLNNAGEDINDISSEMRALLTKQDCDGQILASKEEYHEGKNRRYGKSNPELADVEFWNAMVRAGVSGWRAAKTFGDTKGSNKSPVWCFSRFGKSINELPDGRIVEIAGEHEDYYDPDFCIYNDVVVHKGNGEFDIYIYPKEVFPPTDFHTATLVDNHIYIIGNLGYQEDRIFGYTPVYRLNCETFKIEKIETRGQMPDWISRHKAYYDGESIITIKGGKINALNKRGEEKYREHTLEYKLSLDSMEWSCVS